MTGIAIVLLVSFFVFLVASWMINIEAAGASGHSVRKKLLAFLGWFSMSVAIVFALTAGTMSGILVIQPHLFLPISVLVATGTTYIIVKNPQIID